MRHTHTLLYYLMTAMALAACGGDGDSSAPGQPTETVVTAANIEFPAARGGASVIVRHNATLNDRSGLKGLNYSIEWDTEIHAQRWVCYKLYNTVLAKNVQRYSASNDGSLSSACQYPNDPDLPEQYRLTADPYKYSGYDHGHICPSADRLCSQEANYQTFYITNMQPQGNAFNAGIWADMETQVRLWAGNFDTLYVCKGGTIDKSTHIVKYLGSGDNKIPVPRYFFMALLGRTGNSFRATAFWIDQTNYQSESLRSYVFTVGELQEKTGIDFFHNLPDNIENAAENPGHPKMQQEWSWYK